MTSTIRIAGTTMLMLLGLMAIRDARAATAAAAAAASPSPVRFSDGTAVELVGIADQAAAEKNWWSPDGSAAADPQFQSSGSMSVGTPAGSKMLQVIVKAAADEIKGKTLVVRAGPRFAAGLLKVNDASGNLIKVYTPAPLDQPTIALRFGLASGAGKETILWPPPADAPAPAATQPAATQPAAESLKFVALAEENGQTIVQIKTPPGARRGMMSNGGGGGGGGPGRVMASGGGGGGGMMRGKGPHGGPKISDLLFGDSPQEQAVSVVPRGTAGQKLSPTGFEMGGDGLLTLRFRCPKDQVEKVILTTRDYEWIEMQNVSTKPTPERTDVKLVNLEKPPQ